MADIKHCGETSVHGKHQWTDRARRVDGIPEDTLQYHVCNGTPSKVPALNGATNEPAPEYMIANAGEFAARWNTLETAQREALWERIRQNNDTAMKCFQQDHDVLLEQLRDSSNRRATARSEIQGLLDSLDSHVTQDEIYSAMKAIQEAL